MVWFYLLSGLFLGWSLGANDAANVFGTAVGTRMIKFKVAAFIASAFVIIGAVISGSGAAHTLGKLGAINALGGAFTVALAAAVTVSWMTKLGLPVSTTQAIVGAIIGWDFFAGVLIDTDVLTKIVMTWVICPILTGVFSFSLFKMAKVLLKIAKIHLLELDLYTRLGLILIGAFGAYSLGANNIANVMGVFVTANPFKDITFFGITLSGTQILFLIGGIAIAIGIFTYSHRVMKTVGSDIFRLSPIAALIVVLSESFVLFIFASESLERLLIRFHLPTIPLVPVSSSQAVVGGVIGIGLARGSGRAINFRVLTKIFWGWILTPLTAGIISFFSLFFMQNVFQLKVYEPVIHQISEDVIEKLHSEGIYDPILDTLKGKRFKGSRKMKYFLKLKSDLNWKEINKVLEYSIVDSMIIDSNLVNSELDPEWFTKSQIKTLKKLHGFTVSHRWQLVDTLQKLSPDWRYKPKTPQNKHYNKDLTAKYQKVFQTFRYAKLREREKGLEIELHEEKTH